MASAGCNISDDQCKQVVGACKKYNETVSRGKDPNKLTNQAFGKLTAQRISDKKPIKDRSDIAFTKCCDKKTKVIDLGNKDMVKSLLAEEAKVLQENDAKCKGKSLDECAAELISRICIDGDITAGTTKTAKVGGVDRMTDTSKYTGAHKERFDASGKGKGIDGREERADSSGYVGNYKGKDTYDKKH